jgi:hypothetical protein
MKVKVDIRGNSEEFEARDASDLLSKAKAEAAKRAPLLLRAGIKVMPDLTFAGEIVKRHNSSKGASDPAPKSAQEFVDWATQRGYITILEN